MTQWLRSTRLAHTPRHRRGCWMLAVALFMVTGCENQRPGFLSRLTEDCRTGDQEACSLLAGPVVVPPGPQQPFQPAPRPRSVVQRDVDAIIRGIERTRATPLSQVPENDTP